MEIRTSIGQQIRGHRRINACIPYIGELYKIMLEMKGAVLDAWTFYKVLHKLHTI